MVLQVSRFAHQIIDLARKTALPLALGAAFVGAAAPASAQIAPPEPHRTVDANGVNLLSGTMEVKSPTISVGPAGKGGLSYSATFDTSVQQWRHGVAGGVYTESTQVQPTYPYAIAAINGESMSFAPTAGGYLPVDNPSASIVFTGNVPTVTLGDGSVAAFQGPNNGGGLRSNRGSISTLTRPNGEVLSYAYDTSNRLLSVTNNFGYQLHFDYTTSGFVVTALNNAVDACAPTATTCSYSRTWPSLTFAANSVQQTVTDALSRVTTLTFASTFYGQINSIQTPGGKTVTLGYGTVSPNIGKLTSVSVSGGASWTYNYVTQADPSAADTNHNIATVTDPLGHTRTIGIITFPDQYAHGTQRLEYDQNALGKKTSYGWTGAFGLLTRIDNPDGDYVTYDYDGRGNIGTVIKHPKPSIGGSNLSMSAVYPTTCSNSKTCNKPSSVTDFRGATTDFTYDTTHGGVLTVTQPTPKSGAARPQTRTTYSALSAYYYQNGVATVAAGAAIYLPTATSQCRTGTSCSGASNELFDEQIYSRSTSGLLTNLQPDTVRKKAGDGTSLSATSVVYTAAGDVQDVTDPLGRQSHNEYDAMRQKLGSVSPDPDSTGSLLPRAQYITYDADGQVTSVKTGTVSAWNSSPSGLTVLKDEQTHYDAINRKDQTRLVVGATIQALTEYGYDSANRLQCTALRMDKTTFSTTPVSGCSERTNSSYAVGSRDRITYNTYDNADRLTVVTSGYLVDAINDRTTAYTDNGKVLSETDGEGNKTLYAYDGFDRLQTATYPSVTKGSGAQNTADYETYGYDENDNRTSWRRRDGNSITTAYDALNRPMTKTVAASADIAGTTYAYDYDNFGDMISAAEGVRTIESAYDVQKRLKTETLKSSGTTIWSVNYDYDAASRRIQLTWPDNFYVTYGYDDADALSYIRRAGSTASADNIATLGYDNMGRRTSLSRGNGASTAYGYDASLLLLNSTAHSVTSSGDNVSFGLTYNVAGQVTRRTISNSAYVWNGAYAVDRAYGTNGLNQLTTAGSASLSYDSRGDLKTDGTTTWKYDLENRLRGTTAGAALVYDPLGRLYETTTAGGTVTRYLYDGPNLIGEYNGSNVLQRRYVGGLGADEPLARYTGSGTSAEWMLADHQGSIIAITNSAGAVTTKNTYDEYGVPGSGNAGLFQYTGQVYLSDLSLYHYKARAYSPTLGRFLQTDPTGYDDGLNWYAYVGNDPLNRSDPTGTVCWGNCPVNSDEIAIGGSFTPGEQFFAINVNSETRGTWGMIGAVASMFIPGGQEVAGGRLVKAVEAAEVGTVGRGMRNPTVREAVERGIQAHKDWNPGPGYRKEVTLENGKRADAVNFKDRHVKELKPDNPRAIKAGEKQVEGYRQQLEKQTGKQWTCSVETYCKK